MSHKKSSILGAVSSMQSFFSAYKFIAFLVAFAVPSLSMAASSVSCPPLQVALTNMIQEGHGQVKYKGNTFEFERDMNQYKGYRARIDYSVRSGASFDTVNYAQYFENKGTTNPTLRGKLCVYATPSHTPSNLATYLQSGGHQVNFDATFKLCAGKWSSNYTQCN